MKILLAGRGTTFPSAHMLKSIKHFKLSCTPFWDINSLFKCPGLLARVSKPRVLDLMLALDLPWPHLHFLQSLFLSKSIDSSIELMLRPLVMPLQHSLQLYRYIIRLDLGLQCILSYKWCHMLLFLVLIHLFLYNLILLQMMAPIYTHPNWVILRPPNLLLIPSSAFLDYLLIYYPLLNSLIMVDMSPFINSLALCRTGKPIIWLV